MLLHQVEHTGIYLIVMEKVNMDFMTEKLKSFMKEKKLE